jgi:hypothetical protein
MGEITNPPDLPGLLTLGGQRRKREDEENRDPDQPHGHLGEDGWRRV